MIDLAAIRRRAEAASGGSWYADLDCYEPDDPWIEAGVSNISQAAGDMLFTGPTVFRPSKENWQKARESQEFRDAEFIAHARTDVPALCDRVEALEKALGALLDDTDHIEDCLYDKPGFLCACSWGDACAALEGKR